MIISAVIGLGCSFVSVYSPLSFVRSPSVLRKTRRYLPPTSGTLSPFLTEKPPSTVSPSAVAEPPESETISSSAAP